MSELLQAIRKSRQAPGVATIVALVAMSVGVYAVVSESPVAAVTTPSFSAIPERVYTGINQDLAFSNMVDPISDDNRTIAVSLTVGAVCHTDPQDSSYSLANCNRVQLTFSGTTAEGLMFIPNLTVYNTQYTNNTDVARAPSGAIIDQLTAMADEGALVYHIAGTEDEINDTLATMLFQPGAGFEDLDDVDHPPSIEAIAINGGNPAGSITKYIEIKVEGQNGAPTLTVPAAATDAPADTEQQYPDVLQGNSNDPSNRLADAVDPEMCDLDLCGPPYSNPGGVEDDDQMLLIAWLDPSCGQFHLRGGQFGFHGGVLNTTVPLLLTNVSTGQNPGLELTNDQAAAIQTNLSLQAQTVDLTLQSSTVTDLTNAWAGVGDIDEVRYALSQITYKSPTDLGICDLNVAVSDLGNSGMPAAHGYVGSPIGGADMPQPGYEVPDAKSDQKVIKFNVKDTHPHVTVEQAAQGPGTDPTNASPTFTATFSESVESLTAAMLTISGSAGATTSDAQVTPGPSDTYTITVNPPADGTVVVSIPADKVHASAGPMDSTTLNKASTSTDNSITYDTTGPMATISVAAGQISPTSVSPINFSVQFDEAVDPFTFDSTDISFAGSSAGGALTAFVTPVNSSTFDVSVAGMTTSGLVTASVNGGGVDDLAGNGNAASGTASVTWTNVADVTAPTVTIEQAAGQADPTSTEPVQFTATFSEPVVGFTSAGVALTGAGSAGATASVSGGPIVYTVSVTNVTVNGPITADINAGAATDGTNPSTASTSTDHTVMWAQGMPGVTDHFTVTTGASTTAGAVKTVTVTAKDFTNATVMTYGGTVHITSSDGAAQLPADATLTNGVGTFAVIFKTAGAQTATATDTVMASITGTTSTVTVNPAATTKYTVSIPAGPSTGVPTTVTVTAKDTYNNLTPAYGAGHLVTFTSTDGAATLPANSALTNGVGTFPVTFNTLGAQTVTAKDFNVAAITGVSNSVTVLPAAATHFSVTTGGSATAGVGISVTVQALDASNAATTNYSGTVHFTSTDGQAVLPANATLVSGTGVFNVTLKTAGNATVTATDTLTASITGTTATVVVSPAAVSHLSVAAPASATNGSAVTVTVTALDQFDNTATGYAGTVNFTSTDGAATLPADMTLTNGVGTPQATFNTNGNQTITATDTVTSSITGTSATISVSNAPPPPATHFSVTGAASSTAGVSFMITVTALDAGNAATTGYSGTVHFTSTDGLATLPADATLVNGVGMFSVTLATAGVQTVTATDTVTSSITGTTAGTAVSAAAASDLSVTVQAAATAGVPLNVVVTAIDAYDNTATGYAGTVQITSTDGAAVLPAGNTLTNGVGTFPVTLNTLGNQTVTATDSVNNAITGTSNSIAVSNLPPAPATHFSVSAPATAIAGTPISVTVTALDAANGTANSYSGTVHFTSTSAGTLPADVALVNGVGVVSATLTTSGNRTITATDTVSASITGTSNTIAVAAAPAAKLQISTLVLQVTTFDATLRIAAAGGQQYNFTVTALDQFDNTATGYNGTVHFTSDDPTAELPADSPLTNGVGNFTVKFHTVGTHSVSAVDSGNSAIAGAHSAGVVVAADPVTPTTSTVPTLPPMPSSPTNPPTTTRPAVTPLPATGTDTTSIVVLAVLTLLGGATLVVLRTRRRRA